MEIPIQIVVISYACLALGIATSAQWKTISPMIPSISVSAAQKMANLKDTWQKIDFF